MGVMMGGVALGLGSVILDHPTALAVMKWSGAAFLCWLAWKIATADPGAPGGRGRPVGFLGAAAFQWINPKSWLVCAGATATFLDRGAGGALAQSAAFGLVFVLAALPSCFPWLAAGAALQRVLRTPRAARAFNVAMGALLAASVALLVR
jgi:threonine/homoserine/homoserine lactone efflux protein